MNKKTSCYLQFYLTGLLGGIFLIFAQSIVHAQETFQSKADYHRHVNGQFTTWVKELQKDALKAGVSSETFQRAFKGVKLNWKLPDLRPPSGLKKKPSGKKKVKKKVKKKKKRQPEFASPARYFPKGYLKILGKRANNVYQDWKVTLEKIEKYYGVEAEVVIAVWGRETSFGAFKVPHYAIEALATQAFMGRRKDFFRKQLIIGLQILQEGHVTPEKMKSSWAGAMGYTQFMPYDFQQFAVDFNGDGRRDIWSSIPDALASTANYLRKNGWQTGRTWGYEVRLPKNFDCRLEGFDKVRTIEEWSKLGITRSFDRKFRTDRLKEKAVLLIPGGVKGPAFLVLKNFVVLKTYNPANLYALFVGHLADRVHSNRDFEGTWPGLKTYSRDDMRVLQKQLHDIGYDVGKIDGILGPKTRSIIGEYQAQTRLKMSCYPNKTLFSQLKKQHAQSARVSPPKVQKQGKAQDSMVGIKKAPEGYKQFYPF